VLSHVSKEGHTSEIDVTSLSILTHIATYFRGKVIASGGFLLLLGSAYIETLAMWAHAVYPFDFPPTTVDRWTVLLYFVWLGYRSTKQHLGVQEPPSRPVVGDFRPTPKIFESVIACVRRG
jgi:hypothetical protein